MRAGNRNLLSPLNLSPCVDERTLLLHALMDCTLDDRTTCRIDEDCFIVLDDTLRENIFDPLQFITYVCKSLLKHNKRLMKSVKPLICKVDTLSGISF